VSERTFRAVVAAVLVGALGLAFVISAATLLPRPSEPSPSPTVATSLRPTPGPTITATPIPGPVFDSPGVVSVGLISRGSASHQTLRLEFVEPSVSAIPDAPGALRVTLKDRDGNDSTVAFVGTPSVAAPGSLGATATLVMPNVLMVNIVASDEFNIEAITITGLGIEATEQAAIGPLVAKIGDFDGSLSGGLTRDVLPVRAAGARMRPEALPNADPDARRVPPRIDGLPARPRSTPNARYLRPAPGRGGHVAGHFAHCALTGLTRARSGATHRMPSPGQGAADVVNAWRRSRWAAG